jgi:hypothetical protein
MQLTTELSIVPRRLECIKLLCPSPLYEFKEATAATLFLCELVAISFYYFYKKYEFIVSFNDNGSNSVGGTLCNELKSG